MRYILRGELEIRRVRGVKGVNVTEFAGVDLEQSQRREGQKGLFGLAVLYDLVTDFEQIIIISHIDQLDYALQTPTYLIFFQQTLSFRPRVPSIRNTLINSIPLP